jgi:diaminohydroxyphosphoribosylaminopyrimidine deaminase/5-amino-6-(5-phosphoribosylamino)uracil reductase
MTKRPFVVVKMAIGLDGRIGVKEVISNCKSKLKVHKLRLKSQAILIGTATALVDDPRLNIRLHEFDPSYISTSEQEHKPLRCFLDRTGKFTYGNLLNKNLGPTVIFTNLNSVDKNVLNIWKSHECEIVDIDTENNHLKLDQILDYLGNRGIIQLLVEGGGELVSDFFQKNLVNRFYLFVTPKLLGTGPLIYNGLPFDKFKLIKHKILENDVQLIYDTNKE